MDGRFYKTRAGSSCRGKGQKVGGIVHGCYVEGGLDQSGGQNSRTTSQIDNTANRSIRGLEQSHDFGSGAPCKPAEGDPLDIREVFTVEGVHDLKEVYRADSTH